MAKDTLAKTHKKRSLFELSLYLTYPLAIHSDIEFAIKPATGKCMLRKICLQYNFVRIGLKVAKATFSHFDFFVNVANVLL